MQVSCILGRSLTCSTFYMQVGDGDRSFWWGESQQQNHGPRALGQFTAPHGPGEGVSEAALSRSSSGTVWYVRSGIAWPPIVSFWRRALKIDLQRSPSPTSSCDATACGDDISSSYWRVTTTWAAASGARRSAFTFSCDASAAMVSRARPVQN